jgi:predicted phage terminase large subunit-like protein
MTTSFKLTAKQLDANRILGGSARNFLLYGGSRSGKTFLAVRAQVIRRLKVESRGAALRFRFNHIKESLCLDTFPKVMKLCFPDVPYELNKSDWFVKFSNGSEQWFGGLDDKDRTEKILGKEFADMLFEECSQLSYGAVETALTRLAQKTGLPLRAYFTENPPTKGHWSYKLFKQLIDPVSAQPVKEPGLYENIFMKPDDNAENIAPEYLGILKGMSGARRRRFYEGEFADDNPNALWRMETIDRNRVVDDPIPENMLRIVVSVDPSGADDKDNTDNDAIGIIVAGLASDGKIYVLEDLTLKAGPAEWGKVATNAYERHKADCIVVEKNFGGAMAKHVILTARANTPVREVTASRGKVVRAEPVAALTEDGKIRHVGFFPELEDELCAFSTTGYTGERSPNRADAYVWAVTSLFPHSNTTAPVVVPEIYVPVIAETAWMA